MLATPLKMLENIEKALYFKVFRDFGFFETYRNLSQIGVSFKKIGVKIGVKITEENELINCDKK